MGCYEALLGNVRALARQSRNLLNGFGFQELAKKDPDLKAVQDLQLIRSGSSLRPELRR
jgi:hypothetical protein